MKGASAFILLVFFSGTGPTVLGQDVDTVRVGSTSLQGTSLTEGLQIIDSFVRDQETETRTSTTRQWVTSSGTGDDRVYVIRTLHVSDDTTRSSIRVRADDYSLVHHKVKGARDSAAVTVSGLFLTGWVVLPDQPISLLDLELEHPVFPVKGQIPWLLPQLPLEIGYQAAIPRFSEWRRSEVWSSIRVTGSAEITVGGSKVACWVVDGGELFRGYNVVYWIDKETRRVVQGAARGGEGKPEYWSWARQR